MAALRPFRFTVQASAPPAGADWTSFARRLEAIGYGGLVMADHVVGNGLSPFPALAAAAAATTTLRVGTLALDNDFRNPLLLAREAATVDVISNGRLELGIGAGWHDRDNHSLGIGYDPPRVRVERLAEAVPLIKRLWTEDEVTHAGTHYRHDQAHSGPTPVQQPHPPILIAGGGDRILELAVKEADIVGVVPRTRRDGAPDRAAYSWETALDRFAYVRRLLGDRDVELNTLVFGMTVTDDRPAAIAELARRMEGAPAEMIDRSPFFLVGSLAEMRTQLLRVREAFGVSYFNVRGEHVEAFAPLAKELSGG
ncbi:MAG TPA: LLM class F420-dependent oxidoreductase [Chloroflexi bacterium]|nr:LLM class F420-dependent oxidoreductase [Chloroflexota bacterium]HAL26764.1 LLM class F420-dependent oxidoreductase [Chloroflexota bacterium]